jgi:hypothetical protein
MHCMSLTPGSTVPPLRSSLHVSSLTPELSRESEGESEGGAFARARERARERERERERERICLSDCDFVATRLGVARELRARMNEEDFLMCDSVLL